MCSDFLPFLLIFDDICNLLWFLVIFVISVIVHDISWFPWILMISVISGYFFLWFLVICMFSNALHDFCWFTWFQLIFVISSNFRRFLVISDDFCNMCDFLFFFHCTKNPCHKLGKPLTWGLIVNYVTMPLLLPHKG